MADLVQPLARPRAVWPTVYLDVVITVFSPQWHSPIFYFFPNHGQVGPPFWSGKPWRHPRDMG